MSMSDPIADMLTRIRNANRVKFKSVDIPNSSLKQNIAKVLKDEGYIDNFKLSKDNKQGVIRIYLKYGANRSNTIYGIKRVSKPGRRVYVKKKDVKPVLNGLGTAIISTSRGVMTDKSARDQNVGGEILCHIW